MLSFFRIPKGVLKKLDYYRSRFYWQCEEHNKKYRLARWSIFCEPKSVGGLGITNLEVQNICLLSNRLFKLLNEDGTWQTLLRRKYLGNKTLAQVTKQPGDSHFWSGLMEMKDHFFERGKFVVQNGQQTRFWEDCRCGHKPLMKVYPTLYRIIRRKNQSVASVLGSRPLNVSFRRALVGDKLHLWLDLVSKVLNTTLTEGSDSFVRGLTKSMNFTVKSFYTDMMQEDKVDY